MTVQQSRIKSHPDVYRNALAINVMGTTQLAYNQIFFLRWVASFMSSGFTKHKDGLIFMFMLDAHNFSKNLAQYTMAST
jgi:hypothetical protein